LGTTLRDLSVGAEGILGSCVASLVWSAGPCQAAAGTPSRATHRDHNPPTLPLISPSTTRRHGHCSFLYEHRGAYRAIASKARPKHHKKSLQHCVCTARRAEHYQWTRCCVDGHLRGSCGPESPPAGFPSTRHTSEVVSSTSPRPMTTHPVLPPRGMQRRPPRSPQAPCTEG
jgi:hypothetical protein